MSILKPIHNKRQQRKACCDLLSNCSFGKAIPWEEDINTNTRRLEPLDRVKERGDASVPFPFDVHALIYSENAPELESKLHKAFETKRKNMINQRKEYFHCTLAEIDRALKDASVEIDLINIPEAREYRKTRTLIEDRNKLLENSTKVIESEFLETI